MPSVERALMEQNSADMSDSSPSKKRKTARRNSGTRITTISWPANKLPVEIFQLIISYLPRSNIQNMRFVSREFEEKVSEYLFKIVVVPFKPEIYGISGAADLRVNDLFGAVMLQDKGMRVFEGFGRRIRKFAMSFELDESRLANPPIKSDQEAITSFWGIYRWPYKTYNRYAQLEGLEQTADETRSMAKALRYITAANELGLSIDGGLGLLSGPDINQVVAARGGKPAVFGESRFVPEPKQKVSRKASSSSGPTSPGSQGKSTLYSSFERMLAEAGYQGDNLEASIRLMLETENATHGPITTTSSQGASQSASQSISQSAPRSASQSASQQAQPIDSLSFATIRRAVRVPGGQEVNVAGDLHPLMETTTTVDDEEFEAAHNLQRALFSSSVDTNGKTESFPLKPNDLTTAQKEMLLEIEWAQRAFMQSYAIAVIDNPSTFSNITVLHIARIPSRHLPILRREDFWESLSKIETLSLGVIPDWREIVKLHTSLVQDNKVLPTQAVGVVYRILQEQISRRKNIKTLHFEWLCGGEYASGTFSRNQHILPAPLVFNAASMVNRVQAVSVLKFPYLEHLSLKNCWLCPHVLARFLKNIRTASLHSFKFDSVSLTAPVPLNAQPVVAANHQYGGFVAIQAQVQQAQAQAQNLTQLQQPQGALPLDPALTAQPLLPAQFIPQQFVGLPNPNPNPIPVGLEWLDVRSGSWSQIINYVTPGITLECIRSHDNTLLPDLPTPNLTQLCKLEFNSCGYVRLPLDFEQGMLDPPTEATVIRGRRTELEIFVMKAEDPYLGTIINFISAMESATLQNAWNFDVDWRYQQVELANESKIDGCHNAGQGRFQGLIEVSKASRPNT